MMKQHDEDARSAPLERFVALNDHTQVGLRASRGEDGELRVHSAYIVGPQGGRERFDMAGQRRAELLECLLETSDTLREIRHSIVRQAYSGTGLLSLVGDRTNRGHDSLGE